jgi:hypothetical protein
MDSILHIVFILIWLYKNAQLYFTRSESLQ